MDLTINNVRFMYNFVFEPRLNKMNGKEEFFVRVLVPKSDKDTLKVISDTILEVAKGKWGAKAEQVLKSCRSPLMDGDARDDDAYKGMYYFNAKSDRKPNVVDKCCNPIMDKDEFYSGCWGAFNGNVWAYDNSYGKGISISLQNVMKTKDGEHLAGQGTTAQQAFKAFMDTSSDEEDLTGLL